jgi:hypothetical protein
VPHYIIICCHSIPVIIRCEEDKYTFFLSFFLSFLKWKSYLCRAYTSNVGNDDMFCPMPRIMFSFFAVFLKQMENAGLHIQVVDK